MITEDHLKFGEKINIGGVTKMSRLKHYLTEVQQLGSKTTFSQEQADKVKKTLSEQEKEHGSAWRGDIVKFPFNGYCWGAAIESTSSIKGQSSSNPTYPDCPAIDFNNQTQPIKKIELVGNKKGSRAIYCKHCMSRSDSEGSSRSDTSGT